MDVYSLLIKVTKQNKEVLQVKVNHEQTKNVLLDALASYILKASTLKLSELKA